MKLVQLVQGVPSRYPLASSNPPALGWLPGAARFGRRKRVPHGPPAAPSLLRGTSRREAGVKVVEEGGSCPDQVEVPLDQAALTFADPLLAERYRAEAAALRKLPRPTSRPITYSAYLGNAPPGHGAQRHQAALWHQQEGVVRQLWRALSESLLERLRRGELTASGFVAGERRVIPAEAWHLFRFDRRDPNRAHGAGMDYRLVRVRNPSALIPRREKTLGASSAPVAKSSERKKISGERRAELLARCTEETRKAVANSPKERTIDPNESEARYREQGLTRDEWRAAFNAGISGNEAWSKGGRKKAKRAPEENRPENSSGDFPSEPSED